MNLSNRPQYIKMTGHANMFQAKEAFETLYEIWLTELTPGVWQWSIYCNEFDRPPMRGMAESFTECQRSAENWLMKKLTNAD